jgi:RimJ/RimL family protein N-acetyltransferase
VLHPAYPLRTERLLLRPFHTSDAWALHAYQSRADVCRYIPYPPRTLDTVRERIDAATSVLDEPDSALLLAVVRSEDDVLVGDVMLRWISREHANGEIGYVFDPRYQGHGYATEAANELLRLGFEELDLHRIIARVDARNAASIAVLQRIGMRQEAYLRENEWFKGEWTDEIDFAVLASEWRSWQ